MSNLLPITTVLLKLPNSVSVDDLGNDIVEYNDFIVDNCLVIGKNSTNLNSPAENIDDISIRVDLPKTFNEDVGNGICIFNDIKFEIIGNPVKNPFSPLDWDRYFIARCVS